MKSQIISYLLMVIFLSACASLEGREAFKNGKLKNRQPFSYNEGASGRDFAR